jgi:hypothetical protein
MKNKKNKQKKQKKPKKPDHCISCDCELGIPGGMGGTDLCGPCCTGESETLDEKYISW